MSFAPTFEEHRGHRILRLDFRHLAHEELLAAFVRAGEVIRAAPPRSLRILTLLGSRFNEQSAEAFKAYALANKPHVLASAAVGTAFWNVLVASLKLKGRSDVMVFEDEAAALDWLASR
jgi:hypothetical protein